MKSRVTFFFSVVASNCCEVAVVVCFFVSYYSNIFLDEVISFFDVLQERV